MESIADRFDFLLKSNNMSTYRFCEETNSSAATMGNVLNGSKPQKKTYKLICSYFNVREEWFLTGEDPMRTAARDIAVNNIVEEGKVESGLNSFISLGNGKNLMLIPFVDQFSQIAFLTDYNKDRFISSLSYHPIIIHGVKSGSYFAFRVVGNSMDDNTKDSIEDNSIVTGRVIDKHLWQGGYNIHLDKNYVIVHKNGILIRKVIDIKDETGLGVSSLNKDYPDDFVKFEDCNMILSIVDIYKKP